MDFLLLGLITGIIMGVIVWVIIIIYEVWKREKRESKRNREIEVYSFKV